MKLSDWSDDKKEIAINGSRYKDNIERSRYLYNSHLNKANYFYEIWSKSNKPIQADHKRAMDNLNLAYEDMKHVVHQLMLQDRALNGDDISWNYELWNELYWALPHNLFQFNDKVAGLLNDNGYNEQCHTISSMNDLRISWRDELKEMQEEANNPESYYSTPSKI